MTQATMQATRKIGLIGGLALRAGVHYYDQLAKRHTAARTPLRLILSHADVGTVLPYVVAGDRAGLGQYLGGIANELFDAGADIVAVTAVAPHMAITEIAQAASGPLVDVLAIIPAGLAAAGIKRVAVFGNRAVMETDVFGSLSPEQVVRPEPEVMAMLHAMYNEIALKGLRGTPHETAYLSQAAEELVAKGAQAILLAGTDLSSFYAEMLPSFPFVDVASLHIDEIMRRVANS